MEGWRERLRVVEGELGKVWVRNGDKGEVEDGSVNGSVNGSGSELEAPVYVEARTQVEE